MEQVESEASFATAIALARDYHQFVLDWDEIFDPIPEGDAILDIEEEIGDSLEVANKLKIYPLRGALGLLIEAGMKNASASVQERHATVAGARLNKVLWDFGWFHIPRLKQVKRPEGVDLEFMQAKGEVYLAIHEFVAWAIGL